MANIPKGNHFLAMVKKNTKGFPMEFFKKWLSREKESEKAQQVHHLRHGARFAVLITAYQPCGQAVDCRHETRELMALWTFSSKSFKTIASTVSSTQRGEPRVIERARLGKMDRYGVRHIESKRIDVHQLKAVELYYHYFHLVDDHNHIRQGVLQLESLITHRWWIRSFHTTIGMCATNGYKLYTYECLANGVIPMSSRNFFEGLAVKLARPLSRVEQLQWAAHRSHGHVDTPPVQQQGTVHETARIKSRGKYQTWKSAKLHCRICKHNTHHYCVTCTNEIGSIFPIQ
jgi:hypothetical protein